jgi:hypothetical protein
MSQPQLINVRGSRILPNLPIHLPFIPGNIIHVKPYSGSDDYYGDRPDHAVKTLVRAKALATANQNDLVLFYGEGATAALSADLQSATLDWSKNGVHLVGVHSGALYSPRASVRFAADYAVASNLFTLSASNCFIANMGFYVGVTSALPTGCMSITGSYNHLVRCHLAGMGGANNVIANAYSLSMTNAQTNVIEQCIIGYEQMRGAQTSAELYLNAGSKHNIFKDTLFYTSTSSATTHVFVRVADSFAGFALFDHCKFVNEGVNGGGANMTYAFVAAGTNPGGTILLDYCSSAGVTDWSDNAGYIWAPKIDDGTITGGIGVVQTKS